MTGFLRCVGLVIAWTAGTYAVVCLRLGDPHSAGIAGAVCGAAVVGAGLVDWLHRNPHRDEAQR